MRVFAFRQPFPMCYVPHPNPSPACGRGVFLSFFRIDLKFSQATQVATVNSEISASHSTAARQIRLTVLCR